MRAEVPTWAKTLVMPTGEGVSTVGVDQYRV